MQSSDFDKAVRRLPDWSQLAIGLCIIASLTAFKLTLGSSVSLIDFLFIPVIGVGWFARARWCGYFFAVVAAIDSVVLGMIAGTHASFGPAVASGVARFVLYLVVLGLLGMMRKERAGHQRAVGIDQQTGAANARTFQKLAAAEVARSQSCGLTLSLAYLDLDDFKAINDAQGHAVGDHVLLEVSHVMRSMVRSTDVVARIGGDEFAILLPETNAQAARSVVERVRQDLARLTTGDGKKVCCSIGLVTFISPPSSVGELTETADRLMYKAKNGGKDRLEQAERSGSRTAGLAGSSSPVSGRFAT